MAADDDLREEIRAVSLACGSAFPRAAEFLRAFAEGLPPRPATTNHRRQILRALHATVYGRLGPDPASRMIAAAWAAWEAEPTEGARLGTPAFYFEQLAAFGYRLIRPKSIFNDLTL